MDKFVRSVKFLLAINKGVTILNKKYLDQILIEKKILNFNDYVYINEESENIYKYDLK